MVFADISPVHKKNDYTDKTDHRLVSLLPSVSKVFERLISSVINSQARSEGVAPVASRCSYELAQKSFLRSEINPSSRVDYIKFITKHTSLC